MSGTEEIDKIEATLGEFASCIRHAGAWSLACAQAQNDARVALASLREIVERLEVLMQNDDKQGSGNERGKRDHFADRLSSYWRAALVAMSQGGNRTVLVDQMFVDDLRACEVMVREFPWDRTGQGSGA